MTRAPRCSPVLLGLLALGGCSDRHLAATAGGSEAAGGSTSGAATSASMTGTGTPGGTSDAATTSAATTDDDGDDGVGFIQDPDASSHPGCDVERQLGCARGEKCMLEDRRGGGQWTHGRCHPVDPNGVELYEPCTYADGPYQGPENCDAGGLCMWPDADGVGQCIGLCTFDDPDTYDPHCEDPAAGPQVGCHTCFCLCIPSCDPIAQDCPDGSACYPVAAAFQCAPDASGDDGSLGAPCEYVNVCDPGLFCAAPESIPGCVGANGCCGAYCDLQAPACAPGTTCEAWFEPGQAPPGLESVGACRGPG